MTTELPLIPQEIFVEGSSHNSFTQMEGHKEAFLFNERQDDLFDDLPGMHDTDDPFDAVSGVTLSPILSGPLSSAHSSMLPDDNLFSAPFTTMEAPIPISSRVFDPSNTMMPSVASPAQMGQLPPARPGAESPSQQLQIKGKQKDFGINDC